MKRMYPNCIPVMGMKHIVFHDLERQLFKHFCKTDFFSPEEINNLNSFDLYKVHENGLKLLQAHQFILNEDTIISTGIQPSAFYKWKSPSLITNAIIELSVENGLLKIKNVEKLLNYLEKLVCKHIVLKITDLLSCEDFKCIIDLMHHSELHSIQLILPFSKDFDTDAVGTFIMEQPKIKWIIFESSPFNRNLENKIFFHNSHLKASGKKTPEQFVSNLLLFSESQLHHNYFNRKLFIGRKGEIKNAPECNETHGFIQEIDHHQQLVDLVKTAAFQKLWYVTKEQCEICKDCEFRFMCIDNRVPHQRKNGYWYHLQECNYDPYTGNWNEGIIDNG